MLRSKFILTAAVTIFGLSSAAQAQYRHDLYGGRRPVVVVRERAVVDHGHYTFDRRERIDRLAVRLERDARTLLREANAHCNGLGSYEVFESRVKEIARLADHIHDVAHGGGNWSHIRNDAARLDSLFHQAERHFDNMAYRGRFDSHTINHVKSALNRVERSMHDLLAEVN